MQTMTLKGSWHNSQVLKSEKNQTWSFHFLYTWFHHRKGHGQQNNMLWLCSACETGSDEIKQTSKDLIMSCFPAFSLHIWEVTLIMSESVALGHIIANATQIKVQTWHFQHIIKTYLQELLNASDFSYTNLKILKTVTVNVSRM